MPSIQSNMQTGKEAREKGALVPAAPANPTLPIPVANYPAAPNSYTRGPLPSTYVDRTDTQRHFQSGAVPQQRITPLSITSNPIVGAQAASQAIQIVATTPVVSTGGVSSVALTMPSQFSVSGSPGTGAVSLGVTWNPEAPHTVFAGASGTALDEVDQSTFLSQVNATISIGATATQPNDLAMVFTAQDVSAAAVFSPGAPWSTVISSGTDQSIYSQQLSGIATATATGSTSVTHPSWVSGMLLLTAKTGFTPTVLHNTTAISGTFGTQVNLGIGFTPTAGNTLIVAIMGSNSTFFGNTAISAFSDNNSDTWVSLGSISNGSGAGEQLFIFGTSNIAGGATTISFTASASISGGGVYVVEISNLQAPSLPPTFRALASADIPPINLAQNGVNGGVTGILKVGNGGTGADLSATGGASRVLKQASIGSVVTVAQLAASDLSNGTTGSGSVVLAASPVLTGTAALPIVTLTGKITNYNSIATVSDGVPAEYATVDLTAQAANIGASTLYAVPSTGTGMYRVSSYIVMTTAASVSSTMPTVQIVYTDNDTNTSVTMDSTPIAGAAGLGQTGALTANTVGTAASGVIAVFVKPSTTIQYQTVGYASTAAGMQYALHLKLEAL